MCCYIGIDIGTTHIKTGVFSEEGELLKLFRAGTPVEQNELGDYYEPKRLFGLVESQLHQALEAFTNIAGIGVTGMAEAGLVMDKVTMNEMTPIIPWYDKRTLPYADSVTEEKNGQFFYRTGLRNSFKYGIYKYLWCLDHGSMDREKTIWLSVCDYIYYRLTNEICTEATFAARTYVYDIRQRSWDEERLAEWGLTSNNFPVVVPSGAYKGYLIGTEIPVALCGHDHVCSAFGLLEKNGQLCNSCGTAETYIGTMEKLPEIDSEDKGIVYGPYVDGTSFFGMANLSSSGQSLEWMRKQVQDKELTYERVNELLESLPDEVGDIMYFPYLSGMGSPMFEANATAAILGLKANHTIAHLLRAVIEGICYQSKWIVERGFGSEVSEIISVGGATDSLWWMQCKANVLNKKIVLSDISEGTLQGAVALMKKQNNQAPMKIENKTKIVLPNKEKAIAYQRVYGTVFLPYAKIVSRFSMDSIN